MAFQENLSAFFTDFGDDGLLAGTTVRGTYTGPTVTASLGEVGIDASEPQFELPTAMVPADSYGLHLVIPQGHFTVRQHLPDGTGMSLLLLTKG
jgi:hypothetical protein